METKKCIRCNQEKLLSDFRGNRSKCYQCEKELKKIWDDSNREKIRTYAREHQKIYRENNPEKTKESSKKYRDNNKEKVLERSRKWRKENRENTRKYMRKYLNERFAKDPAFKILWRLRSRMKSAVKKQVTSKTCKSTELISITANELRNYLEGLFLPGMTWDNYGEWHIDHILPCASFDLTDPEQQKKCFHYTNLQPLWKEDNIRKSDDIVSSPKPINKINTQRNYLCH